MYVKIGILLILAYLVYTSALEYFYKLILLSLAAALIYWIYGNKNEQFGGGPTITMSDDYGYLPSNITVNEGTTITWKNTSKIPHTVTSSIFDSGQLRPGDSYSFTFDTKGNFNYHCTYHHTMKGNVNII